MPAGGRVARNRAACVQGCLKFGEFEDSGPQQDIWPERPDVCREPESNTEL